MSELQTDTRQESRGTPLIPVGGALRDLARPPASQIPFLDGLRSIAVLLVINGHAAAAYTLLHGKNWTTRIPFVANGWIGVDLFFILSGFFIGGQLWSELTKTGTVDVGRFILRRGLRIWPLYLFTYLCVLAFTFQAASAKLYGISDVLFVSNYFSGSTIVLGGWSLSTEEQFYLLAPLSLLILSHWLKGIARFRPVLWTMLFVVPVVRLAIVLWMGGHLGQRNDELMEYLYHPIHAHCDGLIVGMFLSNLWIAQGKRSTQQRIHPAWILLGGFVVLVVLRQLQREVFIFTGLAAFFGAAAWFGLHTQTRIFQSRLFYWISKLSFGMYLNHLYMAKWVVGTVLPALHLPARMPAVEQTVGFLILALFSMAVSLVTFCLIEFPFLELRARWLDRPARLRTREAAAAQ